MSLPKRIYDLYRDLQASELVTSQKPTDENMAAFANLLNQCNPSTPEETAQRDLVRGMYYSNPVGFLKYISLARNRVSALILYTESKRVAKFFNLNGLVHIKWDETTSTYSVTNYVPREQRPGYVPSDPTDLGDENQPTDSRPSKEGRPERQPKSKYTVPRKNDKSYQVVKGRKSKNNIRPSKE